VNYQAQLVGIFGAAALDAAKAHARAEFPKESCGFIVKEAYVPAENKADDPLQHFKIEDPLYDAAVVKGELRAVVHSHPNGPMFPTELDMQQQLATGVPWLIVNLNEDDIADFTAWGDALPRAPIIGRPFMHGIFDCYSCIRDTFHFGKDELAKQGIVWPFDPIELPQVPRDDAWWKGDQDLYVDHLEKAGFKTISMHEARPGDGFLMAMGDHRTNPKKKLCHAALLVGGDFILHHKPGRPSGRELAGMWAPHADIWVRYEGPGA
jgi:proteasome lid subunit RPN8/RPN11